MSVLGSVAPVIKATTTTALRLVYDNNAILLNDALSILISKISPISIPVPLPLIGFKYKVENPEFLRYVYSELPFLNKQVLVNSAIKEPTNVEVIIYDVLHGLNPMVLALVKRQGFIKLLEEYADAGGTFTIMTLWGTITNCVLTGLTGVTNEAMDGTTFRASFTKPNFGTSSLSKQLSSTFEAFAKGGL